MSVLALHGGPKAVTLNAGDMFTWPIVTREDEEAVLSVLHDRSMSGSNITYQFEKEFAQWQGVRYALGFPSGTASLQAAMYAVGVRRGDEIICPSVTYWASCLQVYSLGGTVVFADIDPETYCIDPADIERRIGPRTKAIMAVHYFGHPADMDPIMEIAKRHGLKVIEDVSHAQGGYYKGRKLGSIGDVAAMSMMTGKSFAIGEAGMLATNQREIYERAIGLGSYERFNERNVTALKEELHPYFGLPMGGYKYRMNQMCSAMGLVQLKYYDERIREIDKAMNYFLDLLEGTPGIRRIPVDRAAGSTMAGWYCAHAHYVPEELGGLSVTKFVEAVQAEGVQGGVFAGANAALHTHADFHIADIYGDGKPTRIAFSDRDVRKLDEGLEVSERLGARTFALPWFKHYRPEIIREYADAFKKVAANYQELLAEDDCDTSRLGRWFFF